MAFSGQMHDRVRAVVGQNAVERGPVADVDLFEGVSRRVGHRGHVVETGGIGQRIEVDDLMSARNRKAHHGGPDETSAARDEDLHAALPMVNGLSRSLRNGALASLSDRTGASVRPQSIPMSGSSNRTARSHSGA